MARIVPPALANPRRVLEPGSPADRPKAATARMALPPYIQNTTVPRIIHRSASVWPAATAESGFQMCW